MNKLIIFLFFIIFQNISFAEKLTDENLINQSIFHIKNKDYSKAAISLLEISKNSIESDNRKDAAKYIILATICLDKLEDKSAYITWKYAIDTFFKEKTSWEEEKRNIKKDDSNAELKIIFEELNVDEFLSPKTGYRRENFDNNIINNISDLLSKKVQKKNNDVNKVNDNLSVVNKKEDFSENKIINSSSEQNTNIKSLNNKNNEKKEIIIESLNKEDNLAAIKAWQYFENNYNPSNGFFYSNHGYKYSTMWDIASGFAGIVSAEKLGIIDKERFKRYLTKGLKSLGSLKLFNNELPNREYNISNLSMGGKQGNGWSAIDIGRLLIWLKIIDNLYPEERENIRKIVNKWSFKRLIQDDKMYGLYYNGKVQSLRQEGRLGYEQYAAYGYKLWNKNLIKALDYEPSRKTKINNIEIIYDTRNLSYLTSEGFFLSTLELGGIDDTYKEMTYKIYQIQKERWKKYNILTAVSEDSIDKFPWFTYNTIYFNNKPWLCVNPIGKEFNNLKSLSLKTVFAFDAIFEDEYTKLLRQKVINSYSKNNGFYSGIYENNNKNILSNNINTNSVVLESLLYKKLNKKSFINSNIGDKK